MGLKFPPKPGQIVICDYDTGFKPPEMVKTRLAVVVSPRLPHRDGLATLVPLSTTPAKPDILYQCKIELPFGAPPPFAGKVKWAKADMLATLSFDRLTLPYTGRDPATGKRKYLQNILAEEELNKVRAALLYALGLGDLTQKL